MKKLITNYTFNPIAKTVVFADYDTIDLSQVLLITNTTDNIIIYNFACTGGTVTGNTLTLAYDTSAMDSGDSLQIYYDDPEGDAVQYTFKTLFSRLFQILRPLNVTAGAGNSHLSIDIGKIQGANPNVATIGGIGTVSTVANQTFSGGVSTFLNEKNLSHMAYQNNIRSHIYFN